MFLLHGFEWTMSRSGAPELRQPLPCLSTTTPYAKCRAQHSNTEPWHSPTAAPVITQVKVGGISLGPAEPGLPVLLLQTKAQFPQTRWETG